MPMMDQTEDCSTDWRCWLAQSLQWTGDTQSRKVASGQWAGQAQGTAPGLRREREDIRYRRRHGHLYTLGYFKLQITRIILPSLYPHVYLLLSRLFFIFISWHCCGWMAKTQESEICQWWWDDSYQLRRRRRLLCLYWELGTTYFWVSLCHSL